MDPALIQEMGERPAKVAAASGRRRGFIGVDVGLKVGIDPDFVFGEGPRHEPDLDLVGRDQSDVFEQERDS